jgi:HEXXH motif-containing protein
MDLTHFSNPHEGDFLGLAEHLACRNFRGILARANSLAEQLGTPSVPIDSGQITPDRFSTRCWSPELGAARMGLARGITSESWSWLSGQLLLAAFLCEIVTSVNFEITATHPVSVAGHFLYSDRLLVCGDHNSLVIKNGDGKTMLSLTKVQAPGVAPLWAKDPEHDVIALGNAATAVLTDYKWMSYWIPEAVSGKLSHDSRPQKQQVQAAASLLQECCPLDFIWVSALLKQIVFLGSQAEGTQSQSFALWPGHVHISQNTIITMLIVLLHECSHQYFHMALWCGRVAKPDAPENYSVLTKSNRPLNKILLGFHAFGIVLLAIPALQRLLNGSDRDEYVAQFKEIAILVSSLDNALRPHWESYLEGSGKDLYVPLRNRLIAAGLLCAEAAPAG